DTSHFDYAFLNRAKMQVVVTDDPANPEQFTVTITYNSEDLPIWNLFTFALPSQKIKRYSTVRVGGM
ncbi:MAG: pilus assembly protein, partial [Proteobacteria bacterium]|nr:pilus assembly protein [Pseudomonadota bacterium]